MPCFPVPRPDLKAHGIHVKAGFEEIHPRVVKVGLLHTVLRQARYHGWPRGHICCVRWVWRRFKCCWRTFSKRNTCGDATKVECKPSGWNLLGRWNPEIQPKTINKKRRFSDIWFDMHWSNFWLPVFSGWFQRWTNSWVDLRGFLSCNRCCAMHCPDKADVFTWWELKIHIA